jgi:hypothetical protein
VTRRTIQIDKDAGFRRVAHRRPEHCRNSRIGMSTQKSRRRRAKQKVAASKRKVPGTGFANEVHIGCLND